MEIQTYSTDLHLYLYSYIHPVPLRMPLEYSLWVAAPRKAEARNTSKTPNSKLQTPNSKLQTPKYKQDTGHVYFFLFF